MIKESVKIGKKEYCEDLDLQRLAEKVIKKENIDIADARIRYLFVSPNIGKTTAARVIRTGAETKLFSECDYLLEVSRDIWNSINDDIKEILIFHELLHIYPMERKGEMSYQVCDHDVQDFAKIIKKHGVDWLTTIKETYNSINDSDKPVDGMKINL